MIWTEKIEAHYERNWQVAPETCPFTTGPIHQLPLGFKGLAFPPHPGRSMWTYATCGMSQPDDLVPLELHLFSPARSEGIVELLFAICHFHRTGKKLNLWHTVNFGRSWLDSSLCTFGLISLPYLDGPNLENLEEAPASIKFYWLIPITQAELDLKKTAGVEALEERFESLGFKYCDPKRPSVA